jgi:hypothetical protein
MQRSQSDDIAWYASPRFGSCNTQPAIERRGMGLFVHQSQAGLGSDRDVSVGQPCPRTAARKAVIARVTIGRIQRSQSTGTRSVTISLIVKPLITE